jgi:hypothetical protein|tara:strand:+ start:1549 stop:1707 length:159 start_codon:yes stop_codon:yes gene_type:complete
MEIGRVEEVISLLEEAIEFEDWFKVEQSIEIIRTVYDDPFNEYRDDDDLEFN